MFDSSKYYHLRNNHPTNIFTHHSEKFSKLRRCNRQQSQYDRAAQAYIKQNKQMEQLNSNLEETISKLKIEKRQLQKSLEAVLVHRQMVSWERMSLQKTLKQQQQQIIIYRTKNQEKEQGQSLLRRQNLMQEKQIDSCISEKNKAQSTQLSLIQQNKTLQEHITAAMKMIQVKTQLNRQYSQKLEEVEQQNLQCIKNVNNLEDMIEANTLVIQKKLIMQSELANQYADLKRNKRQIFSKITEMKQEIQQENSITSELQQVQQSLNQSFLQIQRNIEDDNNEIVKLKSQTLLQKKEVATNRQCLMKLRLYLQSLKNENGKIELYIQHIFEQDQKIKAAIDRKHNRNYWKEASGGDNTMGSTFG